MIFLRNDFLFLNRSRNLESSLVLNFLFWHLSNPRKKNSVFGGDFLFSLFFSFWGEGELAWNYTMNLNTSWQLLGMSELLCDRSILSVAKRVVYCPGHTPSQSLPTLAPHQDVTADPVRLWGSPTRQLSQPAWGGQGVWFVSHFPSSPSMTFSPHSTWGHPKSP